MVKLGHCVSSPSNPSYCIINKHICFSDATFDIVFEQITFYYLCVIEQNLLFLCDI